MGGADRVRPRATRERPFEFPTRRAADCPAGVRVVGRRAMGWRRSSPSGRAGASDLPMRLCCFASTHGADRRGISAAGRGREKPMGLSWRYPRNKGSSLMAIDNQYGSTSAADVETELVALRADVNGLADSLKRLVQESPELVRGSVESSIRRQPLKAMMIAAGVGFITSIVIRR